MLRDPNVGCVVGEEGNHPDNSAVDPRGIVVTITSNHNTRQYRLCERGDGNTLLGRAVLQ